MNDSKSDNFPTPLIPLNSDEPLWEWDVVTDKVFLSRGLLDALRFDKAPEMMRDFYAILPPDVSNQLIATRVGILSGATGSVLDCSYLLNGLWAHENLMVLTRDKAGKATRIIGRLIVTPLVSINAVFRNASDSNPVSGIWLYDKVNKKLYRDSMCNTLLGRNAGADCTSDMDSVTESVHPDDRDTLRRHFDLFCGESYLGDHITDMIRAKGSDGYYINIIVRTSALRRNEDGKATLLGGIIAHNETEHDSNPKLLKDDRLYHALNALGSGQWNWDAKGDVMHFCKRYLSILGYSAEESQDFASNWRGYIHPDDLTKVEQARNAVAKGPDNGDTYECTYRMRRADGGWAWIFDRGYVTWRDKDGKAGHLIGSITNITTAQAGRDHLEALVRHDSLTGVRSRAYCNLEIEHIEQNKIRPVTVISIDITGLKMINDSLGHAMGDELLTRAATIIRNSLRATDCIARMGGDEFLIILANCNEEKGNKLLLKIKNNFDLYNLTAGNLPVYAGMGMATITEPSEKMTSAIAKADENMYQNKRARQKIAREAISAWIKMYTGQETARDDRLWEDN